MEALYIDVCVERFPGAFSILGCFPRHRTDRVGPPKASGVRQFSTMLADDLTNRLIRNPGAVAMRLRIARLRLLGVRIGRSCWIRRIEVPRNPWDIVIGDGVALDDHVVLLTTGS